MLNFERLVLSCIVHANWNSSRSEPREWVCRTCRQCLRDKAQPYTYRSLRIRSTLLLVYIRPLRITINILNNFKNDLKNKQTNTWSLLIWLNSVKGIGRPRSHVKTAIEAATRHFWFESLSNEMILLKSGKPNTWLSSFSSSLVSLGLLVDLRANLALKQKTKTKIFI